MAVRTLWRNIASLFANGRRRRREVAEPTQVTGSIVALPQKQMKWIGLGGDDPLGGMGEPAICYPSGGLYDPTPRDAEIYTISSVKSTRM